MDYRIAIIQARYDGGVGLAVEVVKRNRLNGWDVGGPRKQRNQ